MKRSEKERKYPKPEFLGAGAMRTTFGLNRNALYTLAADGKIQSVSLRRKGARRGTRLWDCHSVREFLNSLKREEA